MPVERYFNWNSRSFALMGQTPYIKSIDLIAAGALTGTYYYCVVAENPVSIYVPASGYEGKSSGRYYKDSNNLSVPLFTFSRTPASQNVRIGWWNTRGGVTQYYVYRATNAAFTANLVRQAVAEGAALDCLLRTYTELTDNGTGWVSTTVTPTLVLPNDFWIDTFVTDPNKGYVITDLEIQSGDLTTLSSLLKIEILDSNDNITDELVNVAYLNTLSGHFLEEETYYHQTHPLTLSLSSNNWTAASPADSGILQCVGNGDFCDVVLINSLTFTITNITGDLGGGYIAIERSTDNGETWNEYIRLDNWNDIATISETLVSGAWKTLDFLSFKHIPPYPIVVTSNDGLRLRLRRSAQLTGATEIYVGLDASVVHHNNCYKVTKMKMFKQYNPLVLINGKKLRFKTDDNEHLASSGFRFNLSGYYL